MKQLEKRPQKLIPSSFCTIFYVDSESSVRINYLLHYSIGYSINLFRINYYLHYSIHYSIKLFGIINVIIKNSTVVLIVLMSLHLWEMSLHLCEISFHETARETSSEADSEFILHHFLRRFRIQCQNHRFPFGSSSSNSGSSSTVHSVIITWQQFIFPK